MLDISLKINGGEQNVSEHRGDIIVRIWTEDSVKASATALENVRKVVKEKLEEENSATKSLGRVVSKLQIFAAVADEASKVSIPNLHFTENVCKYPHRFTHMLALSGKRQQLCTKWVCILYFVYDPLD